MGQCRHPAGMNVDRPKGTEKAMGLSRPPPGVSHFRLPFSYAPLALGRNVGPVDLVLLASLWLPVLAWCDHQRMPSRESCMSYVSGFVDGLQAAGSVCADATGDQVWHAMMTSLRNHPERLKWPLPRVFREAAREFPCKEEK